MNTKVIITTAVKLTSKQATLVTNSLVKKFGKDITLEQVVDPEVIGGVRLTVGSSQLDATLRHKLDVLKSQLLNI
jgi:F-type H+-transporting ATPase subunit delta